MQHVAFVWIRRLHHSLQPDAASIPVLHHLVEKAEYCFAFRHVSCNCAEFSDMANDYLTKTLKINLKDYKYKIYIVPKGNLCNWGGMAYVGCVNDCRVWVSGDLVEVSSGRAMPVLSACWYSKDIHRFQVPVNLVVLAATLL